MNPSLSESPIVPLPRVLPTRPSRRLPVIHQALREAQVWYVELTYEGRGILAGHALVLQDRHHREIAWVRVSDSTRQDLAGFLWQLIRERYPQWDAVPGSFGVIAWDVQADSIRHLHHQRILDVKTSLIEGL